MKRLIAAFFTVVLVSLSIGAPAEAVSYQISQKTLTPFSGSETALSAQQKAEIKAAVEANPDSEKFICTGIRYEADPASVNIMVRARAKAACAYAKQLNPNLSTWYQNKPTKAKSYAGKVLLTSKTRNSSNELPSSEQAGSKAVYYGTFSDFCDQDPTPGNGFAELESRSVTLKDCGVPTRIVRASMPTNGPVLDETPSNQLLPVDQCKIPNGPLAKATLGHPTSRPLVPHPGPNTTYQVIAVQGIDSPSMGHTPSQDYGKYFDLIEEWSAYNSDWGSTAKVRVLDEYLQLPKKISDYSVGHRSPNDPSAVNFAKTAVGLAESKVDFSEADYLIIVVPPATPRSSLDGTQVLGISTAETPSIRTIIFAGTSLERSGIDSDQPLGWMHGLVHTAVDFDDHYGEVNSSKIDANVGMGSWGIMTRVKTDWLTWEKWILGYMRDTQVRCAQASQSSLHWIAPSQLQTTHAKTIVVPTGQYTAVVIESIRALGMNYRLPQSSEGVLVYTINTNSADHGFGFNVVTVETQLNTGRFLLPKAPLKSGQSVTVQGLKISVEEAGLWGDLVRVAPAA